MTTKLKLFDDAFASMTVAVYQPLILKWISGWTLATIASELATRAKVAPKTPSNTKGTTAMRTADRLVALKEERGRQGMRLMDSFQRAGEDDPDVVRAVELKGFPRAVSVGDKVFAEGVAMADLAAVKNDTANPRVESALPPLSLGKAVHRTDESFDFVAMRTKIRDDLMVAAEASLSDPMVSAGDAIRATLEKAKTELFEFFPAKMEEALSPIGVAHLYRQLYFNVNEGVGPVEQAFTVAPLETLEVMYETVNRQIHEEILELGSEQISERAVESRQLSEVSDKTSSMLQRDFSASMSASASGTIGVWQIGASAGTDFSTSSQSSRETATKKLKETTTRAAERVRKSVTVRTRDVSDVTTTSLNRRVIQNQSADPVAYGLRRVLRRVNVKVQDLGNRMVWQTYLSEPGRGLAKSKYVRFLAADNISEPTDLPGVPPRPVGDVATGEMHTVLRPRYHASGNIQYFYIPLKIDPGPGRVVRSVQVDAISDLEGGGKDDRSPAPANDLAFGESVHSVTGEYSVNIPVRHGDSYSVAISYSYRWEPSPDVMAAWQTKWDTALAAYEREHAEAEFERKKTLITERSRIQQRPSAALRREERYEIMNRLVSHLFGRAESTSNPSPLEIESFYRYFDVEALFFYTFPSWWRPRYFPSATGPSQPDYEITADSEPAPLGSSIGWETQLDGDDRRNHFLNSPWLRICLPINPGREREALAWLARHIEGEIGYDPDKAPLKGMLEAIEQRRDKEAQLGLEGAEFVGPTSQVVDATAIAPDAPATPENLYPVVYDFDITQPTEGFVYDRLEIDGNS